MIQFNRDVSGVCNSEIYGQSISGADCLSDLEGDTAELLDNTAVLAKVDIQLTQNNTLSLRYNFSDFTGENFFSTAGGVAGSIQSTAENGTNLEANTAHSFVASNTTVIGTNKFNEFRFQYSFEERPRLGQSNDVPTVVIADTGTFGKRWFLPITSDHKRLQFTNNFTYLFGNHDVKTGVDVNITDTSQAFFGWGAGYYSFNTLEDYVNQAPFQFTQRVGLNGFSTPQSGTISLGQKEVALYVNDTWRPSPGLTLNMGLRWEGQWNPTAPETTDGLQSRNPADPGLDTIGLVQGDIPDDTNNIAPRFGFAWDPNNDGRTVVRGGAGVFYSRTNLLLMANSFTANGYRQALFFLFGQNNHPFDFPECLPRVGSSRRTIPLNEMLAALRHRVLRQHVFHNPRTTRVEHRHRARRWSPRPSRWARTTSIARTPSNGHRRTNRNLTAPPIGTSMPSGAACTMEAWSTAPTTSSRSRSRRPAGSYHSLVLSARKRFADDFQFQAFYTLSNTKTDDDNERDSSGFRNTQPEKLDADYADSELDVRHRFVGNAVFNIPGDFVFSTLVQAQSGRPYSILSGLDDNGDGNRNDYAVIDDSNRALVQGAGQEVDDGLQGRNTARQPSSFVMDIRLSKVFDFGRPGNLELMFEMFNIFNNANRLTTNSQVSSPNFGFLNIVGSPRQVQLGVRYRW